MAGTWVDFFVFLSEDETREITGENVIQTPNDSILRANPFPEVTDLICRIPLSTLFYRPEAANLGDLMRLLVRTGEPIIISPGFSLTIMDAPDNPKSELLFLV